MADTTTRIYELQVKLAQDSLAQLKKLEGSTKKIESQFASMSGAVKNFGATLVGAFSVGAITSAVQQAIGTVDELGAAAQRVGVGVEAFSALAYAAEQSDMAMADLEIGLKELQKSMVETGTKGANILDALKIDKTKPQVEVLKDFAEAFKTIHDPALRTAALLEVFGKSGLKLRPLLEQGAAGIDELMKKAKELGVVISEDMAKAFSDLDNVMKDSKATTDGLMREMTMSLAPALTDVMKAFQEGAKEGSAFATLGKGLGVIIRALGSAASYAAFGFKSFQTTLGGVAAVVGQVLVGNFKEAAAIARAFNGDLNAQGEALIEAQKKIWGMSEATAASTAATDKNTTSVKNNDAAIKRAIDTSEKKKKGISEEEKLLKALQDQLNALNRARSEFPDTEKAIAKLAETWVNVSEAGKVAALVQIGNIKLAEMANKAAETRADALKELQDAIKGARTEEEQLDDAQRRINELVEQFPELAAAAGDAIAKMWAKFLDGQDKAKPALTDTEKLLESIADKIDGYAKSIADSLVDFATGAQDAKFSFSDFATSVLRDLAKMATQMLLIEPLMANLKKALKDIGQSSRSGGLWDALIKGITGGSGGGGGELAVAKGGVFTSPSLSQYSGGVYDKPRLFSFAQGGVFAEAGPEAVMPLTRGADGSLGVDASGAGVQINVYNESRAEVQTKASSGVDGKRLVEVLVRDAVASGFRSGAFDGVMGATYGLNRMGAR